MTTTYSGNPASSPTDAVRFWIQDTAAPWKLQNEEIAYVLTQFSNPMLAAANCARALAAKYAAMPSKTVGDFSISWGELAKNYAAIAADLESQGQTFNVTPYSGGISWADRYKVSSNPDRVKPPFTRDQFDNPDAGNQVTDDGLGGGAWDTLP